MRVKRFVAPTLRDATAQVWREFGPDALIMHTERVRRPGLLGWLRPLGWRYWQASMIHSTSRRPQVAAHTRRPRRRR